MLKSILSQKEKLTTAFRNISNITTDRVKSWQIHSYGEDLQCCMTRIPVIKHPTDLLVEVEAASVNPIDIAMKDGYGQTVLKLFTWQDMVMPLTLGRDFSGTILDKGQAVNSELKIGDKIYGVIPFHRDGSHAKQTTVNQSHVCHLPEDILTSVEAASLPYAALTAWSALWLTGGLICKSIKRKKILILGASGGVGTCAVQMLKAADACVYGSCSVDALPLVQSLGADYVFDYRDPDFIRNVATQGSFDIILDCAQFGYQNVPSQWLYSSYITLNSPLLLNTDKYGLLAGLAYSAADIIPTNIISLSQGRCVKWAYVIPCNDGIKFIDNLVKTCKLIPIIDKVYSFDQTPDAYARIKAGHLRGKVVIDMLI